MGIELMSEGFGYVQFQDSRDADFAVNELDRIRYSNVVSSFRLMTSSKMARVNNRACVSSRVHICATEYRQLITTCTCANLSE